MFIMLRFEVPIDKNIFLKQSSRYTGENEKKTNEFIKIFD